MRHFLCPSEHLPRLCTVNEADEAIEIVWTAFDFVEGKNSVSTRIFPMQSVDRFIPGILIRLQKFKEVDENSHASQYGLGLRKSAALSLNGVTVRWKLLMGRNPCSYCHSVDETNFAIYAGRRHQQRAATSQKGVKCFN